MDNLRLTPTDIAKYLLARACMDGDLVSPLKMQKLVYYLYCWVLVRNEAKLFMEEIEAWPNGPVIPSLYTALKDFGAAPIPAEWIGEDPEKFVEEFEQRFSPEVLATINETYSDYMCRTAFELVVLSHNEKPWVEARKGLPANSSSKRKIKDGDIREEYHLEDSRG